MFLLSIIWDIHTEVNLLDHLVILSLILENYILFQSGCTFLYPSNYAQVFQFHHILINTMFLVPFFFFNSSLHYLQILMIMDVTDISGYNLKMLLNILLYTGQVSQQKYLAQKVNNAKVRNPAYT